MKTRYLIIAAAAALLAACNNDENEVNDGPVEARITAGIAGPQTRAVGTQWNADNIGVMVTAASSSMTQLYKNVKYTTTSQDVTATFTPATTGTGIFFQDVKETVTFAAYAPYQESDANALPGTNGVVKVDTEDNNGSDKQESIDFLYASGATASRGNSTVTFAKIDGGTDCSFKHRMARLDLVLQVSTTDGFSADQIFADANTVKLSGLKHAGTFNVTTGVAAVNADATVTTDWVITACKKADDKTTKTRAYSLILLPQDASAAGLPLTINIGGQNYMNTGDIKPKLEAGNSYTYTITVKKTGLTVSGCTITDWNSSGTGSGDAEMYIGSKSAAQAAVGDFYMSDGSLEGKNATLTDAQKAACLGVVYWVGNPTNSTDGDPLLGKSEHHPACTHGLVVALHDTKNPSTNTAAGMKWSTSTANVNSWTNHNDRGENKVDITVADKYQGYANTVALKAYNTQQSDANNKVLPIAAIEQYSKDYPASAGSSGWYVPSILEMKYVCWGQGNSEGTAGRELLNTQFDKAGGTKFDSSSGSYWSSSEYAGYSDYACCVGFNSGGVGYYKKNEAEYRVRAVFAF